MTATSAGVGGITIFLIRGLCYYTHIFVTEGSAFQRAATSTSFGFCAGSILPVMTQGMNKVRFVTITAAGAGMGGVALLCACGICDYRCIVMAQSCALSCTAGSTCLGCGTGGTCPLVPHGLTFGFSAGGAGLRCGTGSILPFVAQNRSFAVRVTVTTAASVGSITASGASGFGYNRIIVTMYMIQGRKCAGLCGITDGTGVQNLAVGFLRSLADDFTRIPGVSHRGPGGGTTDGAGLGRSAGGILPIMAGGVDKVACIGIIAAGAGIYSIALFGTVRLRYNAGIIVACRFAFPCATDRTSLRSSTGGFLPLVTSRLTLSCSAGRTYFRHGAGGVVPLMPGRLAFGCSAGRTGLGRSAGCILPLVNMSRLCGICGRGSNGSVWKQRFYTTLLKIREHHKNKATHSQSNQEQQAKNDGYKHGTDWDENPQQFFGRFLHISVLQNKISQRRFSCLWEQGVRYVVGFLYYYIMFVNPWERSSDTFPKRDNRAFCPVFVHLWYLLPA